MGPRSSVIFHWSDMLPQFAGEQRGAENPHDRHGLEAHG